jgi:hypothetical protein
MSKNFKEFDLVRDSLHDAKREGYIFVKAFWDFYNNLKGDIDQGLDGLVPPFPTSGHKYPMYTKKELVDLMFPNEGPTLEQELNLRHLVVLFSLLEALAEEAERLLTNKAENTNDGYLKRWDKNELLRFLRITKTVSDEESHELNFAKEVRNCFIHRKGIVDKTTMNAWKKVSKFFKGIKLAEGEDLREKFKYPDYERWKVLMSRIASRLEDYVKS